MPSTGPTTEAGKAASSRNAVKHGLLSEAPVVTCLESREEWESHRAGVLADLAPNGQMEVCLAERAALLIWRLRRTAQAEIHWFDDRHKHGPEHKRGRSYMPGFDETNCVTRYEAHLGRELARAMKALKDLQSRPTPEGQSAISNHHSPISNTSPTGERTLNGSTPLQLDNPDTALTGGTTENYQTNAAPAAECSETPPVPTDSGILQNSITPADLAPAASSEPSAAPARENCETNSVPDAERSESPPVPTNSGSLHPSRPTREHSTTPADSSASSSPEPATKAEQKNSITPAGQNAPPRKVHESETAECRSVPAPPGFYWSFERRCFRPLPAKPREA